MHKSLFFIFLLLLIFPLISAETVCDKSYISLSYKQGENPSVIIHCNNLANQTVNISKSGDYFSISSNSLNPNQAKDINISFDSTSPLGLHTSQLSFTDSSNAIQLFFYTDSPTLVQNPGCSIDVFPTSLSNVKIQQGDIKTRTIQISIPECMKNAINLRGISLGSDEKPIQLGELTLGIINPGRDLQIPIIIDATDVSVGQYSDTLSILAYDSNGTRINLPTVSISTLVTAGINPISNFSFNMLPTCSLNSLTLSLNGTYTFTCQINNPNIQVRPNVDTRYITGMSVSQTSSQFVYSFSPTKTGVTTFCADYISMNSPIGGGFCSDVRITPSGASMGGGINLKAQFYQNNVKKDINSISPGNTIILILDNSTGNLINPDSIIINGIVSNNTINLERDKSYEVRITASGYMDLVLSNFTVTEIPLTFKITPEKSLYKVGELIYFNSSIENVTYLVDNVKANSPYTFYTSSNHTITAVKEGYISSNQTIQVDNLPRLTSCSPLQNEWKKGSKIICALDKNVSWSAILTPKDKSVITLASGNSDKVEFTITDYGNLVITADNSNIYNQNFQSTGWFNYVTDNWIWFLGGFILLIVIFVIYRRSVAKSKFESVSPYS